MFNLRLPPAFLAIIVSAPAVLVGQLVASGDYSRATHVAAFEVFVVLIAGAIAAQRRLE